jgi:hypothetical protein
MIRAESCAEGDTDMFLDALNNLWNLFLSQVVPLQPDNLLAQLYNILQNLLLLSATFSSS